MVPRRLIEHTKTQNWTAVFLDLVIVVIGVYLGIEVSNWNDVRADREAYLHARERLVAEIDANLEAITVTNAELQESIPRVSRAIDALRSCATGPEAVQTIVDGVNETLITRGIRFRVGALEEITQNVVLLAQQSEVDRRAYQDLRYFLSVMQAEAQFMEFTPFETPIWSVSGLRAESLDDVEYSYRGITLLLQERKLALSVPPSEACKDEVLMANLYEWERLQISLKAVFANVTQALNKAKTETLTKIREDS